MSHSTPWYRSPTILIACGVTTTIAVVLTLWLSTTDSAGNRGQERGQETGSTLAGIESINARLDTLKETLSGIQQYLANIDMKLAAIERRITLDHGSFSDAINLIAGAVAESNIIKIDRAMIGAILPKAPQNLWNRHTFTMPTTIGSAFWEDNRLVVAVARVTPICAGHPGVVSRISNGHTIEITLEEEEQRRQQVLVYRNLSRLFVEVGDKVYRGEMIGTIEPQAPDSYVAQFVVQLLSQNGKPIPPDYPEVYPEIGQRVFVTKCAVCHEATSTYHLVGPGFKGTKAGKLPSGNDATDRTLLEILNKGANGMPPFHTLTEKEKEDVIAYIKTL